MGDLFSDLPDDPDDPPAPHAKGSDTSREAAEAIERDKKRLRGVVLAYIRGRGPDGATDQETYLALGMDDNTERPRRWELVRDGFVVETRVKRRTRAGRPATVWVAAEHVRPGDRPMGE